MNNLSIIKNFKKHNLVVLETFHNVDRLDTFSRVKHIAINVDTNTKKNFLLMLLFTSRNRLIREHKLNDYNNFLEKKQYIILTVVHFNYKNTVSDIDFTKFKNLRNFLNKFFILKEKFNYYNTEQNKNEKLLMQEIYEDRSTFKITKFQDIFNPDNNYKSNVMIDAAGYILKKGILIKEDNFNKKLTKNNNKDDKYLKNEDIFHDFL